MVVSLFLYHFFIFGELKASIYVVNQITLHGDDIYLGGSGGGDGDLF